MGGGLESRCVGRVYGADGAVHHLYRTHDLRSSSQDHHPSKNSVQKTICCNSTPNALDDGRWCPKHVELRILTYSMMQSPSWEANWFAASQEIPRISRNPKIHYRTHKRPPPVSIMGQPNPVHIPTSHLLEIHPNIIHPSTPRSPQWSPSHQQNYIVASSWHFTLFYEEDARSNNPQVYTIAIQCSVAKYSDVGACRIYYVTLSQQIKLTLILSQDCSLMPSYRLDKPQY